MPLRVTIEVIPGGDETRAQTLHVVEITQVAKLDDHPDGRRRYRVDMDEVYGTVDHARGDGALVLAAKALTKAAAGRIRRNQRREPKTPPASET